MAEQIKKIVSVEILYLDELGYGPEGNHTRRQWREECLQNFLAGKKRFEAWQQSCIVLALNNKLQANFGVNLTFIDGHIIRLDEGWSHKAYAIDFVGHCFEKSVNASSYHFLEKTLFSYASFLGDASFPHTTFSGTAQFNRVTVSGKANFLKATFERESDFANSVFKWDADFNSASFLDGAYFESSFFYNFAWFNNTNYGAVVD